MSGRTRERQVFKVVTVFNGHVAECHIRLLTGVELGNRKADCRERLFTLPMHSLKLCTQWLCSVGKDRIFIGLLGEMWKPHLYIVS